MVSIRIFQPHTVSVLREWRDNKWTFLFFLSCRFTAHADEVKGIEFTVTTLNCAHDQATAATVVPEQRHRFSSMRKTGALSKIVRSKISKSFHHSTNPLAKSDKSGRPHDADKIKESESSGKLKEKSAAKATTPTTAVPPMEKSKKRSKLCQLL